MTWRSRAPARTPPRTCRVEFIIFIAVLLVFAAQLLLVSNRALLASIITRPHLDPTVQIKIFHRLDPPKRPSRLPPGALVTSTAALNLTDIVHSRDPFQPHLHVDQHAHEACDCPPEQSAQGTLAYLSALRVHNDSLPAPSRIRLHADAMPEIWHLLSEVYVINLPQRRDRRHYMCTVLSALNIPALFWPAYDKASVHVISYLRGLPSANFNPRVKYDFLQPPEDPGPNSTDKPRSHILKRPRMRAAAIACHLSHREVWHDIVQRDLQRPVLIMEDDVDVEEEFVRILRNALARLPIDWALFWVGHCFEDMHPHEPETKIGHRLYRAQLPTCTHAYAIRNSSVARTLLDELGHDLATNVDLGMASLINNMTVELPAYVMMPPPVSQLYRTRRRKNPEEQSEQSNPSDVNIFGMKLPYQRILVPMREVIVNETMNPDELCNNPLFDLQPDQDSPSELVIYPAADYLP